MKQIIGGIIFVSLLIPNLVLSIQPAEQDEQPWITIVREDSISPAQESEEILWLARVIYSETKNEDEMRLIAWVVRNRVENDYWGDTTYKSVVTRKNQFSGLNYGDLQYSHNISLTYDDKYMVWQKALSTATEIYNASDSQRPFARDVQHFYSPNVISAPNWAENDKHAFSTNNDSFAFYKNVK